jgi:hypothetical protein
MVSEENCDFHVEDAHEYASHLMAIDRGHRATLH